MVNCVGKQGAGAGEQQLGTLFKVEELVPRVL